MDRLFSFFSLDFLENSAETSTIFIFLLEVPLLEAILVIDYPSKYCEKTGEALR